MTDPDFEKLRADRNASVKEHYEKLCHEMGWDANEWNINPDACYCACPCGPCEHDFQGWHPIEDGRGVERRCTRCGMSAMNHSLRTGE